MEREGAREGRERLASLARRLTVEGWADEPPGTLGGCGAAWGVARVAERSGAEARQVAGALEPDPAAGLLGACGKPHGVPTVSLYARPRGRGISGGRHPPLRVAGSFC